MKFSDTLWQQVIPIYQKIITHPFNNELAQGTLSYDRFIFYMEQDAYYLINFSRALGFIAARANSSHIIHHPFNVELAQGTLSRERFIFYMEQDAYYLKNFSRALAFIAARADSSHIIHHFLNFAL